MPRCVHTQHTKHWQRYSWYLYGSLICVCSLIWVGLIFWLLRNLFQRHICENGPPKRYGCITEIFEVLLPCIDTRPAPTRTLLQIWCRGGGGGVKLYRSSAHSLVVISARFVVDDIHQCKYTTMVLHFHLVHVLVVI